MKPYSNILISIPTRSSIKIGLLPALFDWKDKGASIAIETAILIDNARNKSVQTFLSSNKEYLLFVDSDIEPDTNALQTLLDHDKDIITATHNLVYGYDKGQPMIASGCCTTLTIKEDESFERIMTRNNTGLQKVEGAATSFMLIKRKVFDNWKCPWFKIAWNSTYTDFLGEDYWFCVEARKRGFEVWTDTDLLVKHAKEIVL